MQKQEADSSVDGAGEQLTGVNILSECQTECERSWTCTGITFSPQSNPLNAVGLLLLEPVIGNRPAQESLRPRQNLLRLVMVSPIVDD